VKLVPGANEADHLNLTGTFYISSFSQAIGPTGGLAEINPAIASA
jgi:hypothetical protein